MLTYDSVWETFLNNYYGDDIDIPQEQDLIHRHINNAVSLFNNRMRTKAECDNSIEEIDGVETEDDRLIIASYIRLVILKHTRDFYEKLLQGFEGDVGFKNFSAQLVSVRESIKEQEITIDKLIFNTRETFL